MTKEGSSSSSSSNTNSINHQAQHSHLMPQKKFYRSRAHCNPLSYNDGFQYPTTPAMCNWEPHYPMV